ncbi:hypothetical protein ACWGN5_35745 [Streptomyces sp. NPDC055815]
MTTTTTAIAIRPLPANWAPPADWKRDDAAVDPDNPRGERELTGYRAGVAFVLDTDQRDLSVYPVAEGAPGDEVPGEFVTYQHTRNGVAPAVLQIGVIRLNTSLDLARADRINSVLEEVRPLAQEIADNLLPVPGTTGRDWTARAYDACRSAEHLLNRYPYRGTEHDFPYLRHCYAVDAAPVLAAFPDLINRSWAESTDQQLQDAAVALEGRLYQLYKDNPDSEVLKRLIEMSLTGAPLSDRDGRPVMDVRVHGARAWLHAYRRDQAAGLTPMDAARWDGAAHHALHIADDSTDAELAAVARRAERDAAAQGVKLLAADQWAHTLRTDRRTAIRTQLAELRDQIGALENHLKPARKRRTVLVTRVLAWGEEDTDSALGRASGLSHTAVGTIRSSLDTTEDQGKGTE